MNVEKWTTSEFGPPPGAGVYAVVSLNLFTKKTEILYVGSSKNIQRRVLNLSHPYRILFDAAKYPEIIFTKSKLCNNYIELEKTLIRRLQPKYNITYKYKSLSIGKPIQRHGNME